MHPLTRLYLAFVCLAFLGCGGESARRVVSSDSPPWFTDRAKESGVDFVHINGSSGQFYFPENMAPGVGLFDYDGDGDLDMYLVQGHALGPTDQRDAPRARGRLFRNDLTSSGALQFTDVTERSGIVSSSYGMGVAAGDIDNDGCVDLYLTNFGANQLFRNRCDGTFVDISLQSGVDDDGFSVSAAFVDYDRDGWLDLYVGNYLEYRLEDNKICTRLAGERDYCPPHVYSPARDRLYRNRRDGTFVDVTSTALRDGVFGPALGVSTADFNGDGWVDIYVTNDNRENLLWINQRNGTLRNRALLSGAALPSSGKAEASMGVDAGDVDNDGDEDLFMTELTGEGFNLFVNDGTGLFEDRSAAWSIATASLPYTGFGAGWLDFDNDGWLDALAVNGTISAVESLVKARDPLPYHQRKLLFRNTGSGRLEDVTDRAGPAFELSEMGRGAAFGDVDNDGDTDVVIANDAGPTRLLINQVGERAHWLGLTLAGASRRNALGARVSVRRAGVPTLWRRARADGSYGSANDPRVLVGLGQSERAPDVRVQWPSGVSEEWKAVPIDRYTTLTEGSGAAISAP